MYLFVAWLFTLPLVIDKRLDFWPAMRLSRKTITKHWWKFLGFLLVLALLNLAGFLAFCVGALRHLPVSLAALMYAYEDIFNPRASHSPRLLSAERRVRRSRLSPKRASLPAAARGDGFPGDTGYRLRPRVRKRRASDCHSAKVLCQHGPSQGGVAHRGKHWDERNRARQQL